MLMESESDAYGREKGYVSGIFVNKCIQNFTESLFYAEGSVCT